MRTAIKATANFLGISLTTEQIEKLKNHLDFENFRNNTSVNGYTLSNLGFFKETEEGFVRKGKSGNWRDYFSSEKAKEAEQWMRANEKDIGIMFN